MAAEEMAATAAAVDVYVKVMKCKDAADVPEIIECPAEPDGTLLLKTLDDQFTGAQGLMYYDRETHLITPMADKGGVIQPPATGWQGRTFLVSFRPAVGGAKKRGHESALGGDGTPKEACKRLFVGNIPFSIKTKEELSDHFPGTTNIFLPTHTDTLRIKGYAYLEYADIEEAKKTYNEKNWTEIHGRQIRLDYAPEGYRGGMGGTGPASKRMSQNGFPNQGFGGRGGYGGGGGGGGGFNAFGGGGF